MKKRPSQVNKAEQEQLDKDTEQFFKDLDAFELEKGFKLHPIMHYTVNGIVPKITAIPIEKVDIK